MKILLAEETGLDWKGRKAKEARYGWLPFLKRKEEGIIEL